MTAACTLLAAAVLLAAACAGSTAPAAVRQAGPSVPADRVADRVMSEPVPTPRASVPAHVDPSHGGPVRSTLAGLQPAAPVTHANSFEVGGTRVGIVGTYRDCTGRSGVGWAGAYYEPCMGIPYWLGHHAILGAILDADRVTYWDGAGVPHQWRVIGRRVLHAGSTYPGHLRGAVAELQTCVEATSRSPVEIVDYS